MSETGRLKYRAAEIAAAADAYLFSILLQLRDDPIVRGCGPNRGTDAHDYLAQARAFMADACYFCRASRMAGIEFVQMPPCGFGAANDPNW